MGTPTFLLHHSKGAANPWRGYTPRNMAYPTMRDNRVWKDWGDDPCTPASSDATIWSGVGRYVLMSATRTAACTRMGIMCLNFVFFFGCLVLVVDKSEGSVTFRGGGGSKKKPGGHCARRVLGGAPHTTQKKKKLPLEHGFWFR